MGKDIYIHANFMASVFPPSNEYGILIEEELNIQPAFICFRPISKPISKTVNEIIKIKKTKIFDRIFGKNLWSMSIDTKPPERYAEGAIKPVIHNIKKRATSSGQGKALFNTYLKNTWIIVTITINRIAIHASCLPIRRMKVFIFCKKLKNNSNSLIVKFTSQVILIIR